MYRVFFKGENMKKRIICCISAIFIFCFTTVNCYLQPVYASIPGVAEASIIWEGWETLGLILGVSSEFNNNLTISKNNDIQYEYYYNKIVNDTSLSENEKNQLIADLDTTRQGFLQRVINVGSDLWSNLLSWVYNDQIKTDANLYPLLSDTQKTIFNSWSGRCAIIYPNRVVPYGDFAVIIHGDNILDAPYANGVRGDGTTWYTFNRTGSYEYVSSQHNILTSGTGFQDFTVPTVAGFSYVLYPDKLQDEIIENPEITNSLVGSPSWQDYIDGITGNFSIVDGSLVDVNTGDAPIVLDGEALDDAISGIQDGTLTYDQAIEQAFEDTDTGEITDYPSPISKKALDELISGLNISRLENKFPFCIPHDIQMIFSGASAVSANAPVFNIPIHLEFNNHVYYDNQQAIHIDFSMFDDIIPIFKEGFFLLFLVGLLWVSIEILQAFFVVTE